MTKSKGIHAQRAKWTDEQLDTLRRFYPNFKTEDVAFMIGLSLNIVYRKAHQLGLAKSAAFLAGPAGCYWSRPDNAGRQYRFKTGQKPWNTGTKGRVTGGVATQFAKGAQPHNTLPIGSTKLDKSQVLLEKVSNATGNNSKRWRARHELVWIQANGPVPPKHIVVFKPGMKTNVFAEITVDRVECISLADNMRRNTVHNMPKELVDLVRLRGVLTRSINRKEAHVSA